MSDQHECEELIDRHLRGELGEHEMERLAELLDSNPEVRRDLVEQAVWETQLTESLRASRRWSPGFSRPARQPADRNALLRVSLAGAIVVIVGLCVGLFYQQAYAERRIAEIKANAPEVKSKPSIAKVVGLSGSLIWTGDRGHIQRELKVGTELPGGTIEGVAPDSWFELQFNDGSSVMISGASILTFADAGQKVLRLKEGSLSANVEPQPADKPMLIHTHTALLEVRGTQFEVKAKLASTELNVSEGRVRVRRLSDHSEIDVSAKHQLVVEADNELVAVTVPDSVFAWNSELHRKPDSYGKWQPATDRHPASLKAIPLVPPKFPHVTLYLAGMSVDHAENSPVVVQPESQFIVRGRLQSEAAVHFGISVSYRTGEFAGMFRGDLNHKQPLAKTNADGRFEEVYRLDQFSIDPAVYDRKDELAARPDGLILTGIWAFTHAGGPTGLEILEIELIPPSPSE